MATKKKVITAVIEIEDNPSTEKLEGLSPRMIAIASNQFFNALGFPDEEIKKIREGEK
jgi:hypothetical protein